MPSQGRRAAGWVVLILLELLASGARGADIHLAGDSILCDYGERHVPQQGWGHELRALCAEGVNIHNRAAGGLAVKTFRQGDRWAKLLETVRAGDFVVIAFGHNDADKNRPERYADHRTEFRELLRACVAEVRAKDAHPILTTPTPRWAFTEDHRAIGNGTPSAYAAAVRAVGEAEDVPVVDLNRIGVAKLLELGPDASRAYYMVAANGKDNLHLTRDGAAAYARWFVEAAREQGLAVAALFGNPSAPEQGPEASEKTAPAPTTVAAMADADAGPRGPTIHLAGDSTMCKYNAKQAPQQGWGHALPALCREGVKVNNRAIGGRSVKSFRAEGRWARLLEEVEAGDFVVIQFGHNDGNAKRPERYNHHQDEFPGHLQACIDEVRAKGATPVPVTATVGWLYQDNNTKIRNGAAAYVNATRDAAREAELPVVDLNATAIRHMLEQGPEQTKAYYMISVDGKDYLHLTEEGAKAYAQWFAETLQADKHPMAALLR